MPLLAKKNILGLKVASEDPETGRLVSKKTSKPLQVGGPEGRPEESAKIVIDNLEKTIDTLETLKLFGSDGVQSPPAFIKYLKQALPVLSPETYASIEELAKIFPGEKASWGKVYSPEFGESIKSIKKGQLLYKEGDLRWIAQDLTDKLGYRFSAKTYNKYKDKFKYMSYILNTRTGTQSDIGKLTEGIRFLKQKTQGYLDYMEPAIKKINENTAKLMKSKKLQERIKKFKNKDKIEAERIKKKKEEEEERRKQRESEMLKSYEKMLTETDWSGEKNTYVLVDAKSPDNIVEAKPVRFIYKKTDEGRFNYMVFELANGKIKEVMVPDDRFDPFYHLPELPFRITYPSRFDLSKIANDEPYEGLIRIKKKTADWAEETYPNYTAF